MKDNSQNRDKYILKRRVEGKLNLANNIHEAAVHLIAGGSLFPEVVEALEGQISLEELTALMETPEARKRLQYKLDHPQARAPKPKNNEEFKQYALQKLYKIAEHDETASKDKVQACKALGELAHKFTDPGTTPMTQVIDPALQKLNESFVKDDDEGTLSSE